MSEQGDGVAPIESGAPAKPKRQPVRRTIAIVGGVVAGGVVGLVLAFVLVMVQYVHMLGPSINGWHVTTDCGVAMPNPLTRAACAMEYPMVNSPSEGVYWTTEVDSTGARLSGANNYVMHFPANGTPPNDAFWSMTITNMTAQLTPNPIDRYAVSSHSGLVANADGSIDIYIQANQPADNVSNWLPTPAGQFILWLRDYAPGAQVLQGDYVVPGVEVAP